MAEQVCSRCRDKAQVVPQQGGIPFGWSKVFMQISAWVIDNEKPLLVKRGSDLYLCGPCGEVLAGALVKGS